MANKEHGRFLTFQAMDGSGCFEGYLATPQSGTGPGLILIQEIYGVNANMRALADLYAEEGYVVVVPDMFWRLEVGVDLGYTPQERIKAFSLLKDFDPAKGVEDIQSVISALRKHPGVTGKVGVVGFCMGGKMAYLAACRTDADVAVGYYGVGIEAILDEAKTIGCDLTLHIAQLDKFCPPEAQAQLQQGLGNNPKIQLFTYPGVDHAFARLGGDNFHKTSSQLAYQRTLETLKKAIGPHFDLSRLWDQHCACEFEMRDVAATMATMVPEPYVNHIPTMTGGVGYKDLYRFYKNHFVNSNPPDTSLIPVSRTVGATQVVDELLFCFTHTCEIPWMLPGIAPTGKRVEIPLIAVVKFRGDKLYNEHIYWDQASVLVQIGILERGALPVAGVETAHKLLDESLPSNTLMNDWEKSGDL